MVAVFLYFCVPLITSLHLVFVAASDAFIEKAKRVKRQQGLYLSAKMASVTFTDRAFNSSCLSDTVCYVNLCFTTISTEHK